jgi:glycine/sarcosine N-methyltransferase
MSDVQHFYDEMAEQYHFIFTAWEKSVEWQAGVLERFLENIGENTPKTVLDCTCGIGTQAIGLAMKGYEVLGTDLSPRAIERATDYASRFEFDIAPSFAVADLLQTPTHPTEYDVVLAFDNAIAHFHSDEDLAKALTTMQMQLKAGGLLAISLRDYDTLAKERSPHSGMTIADDKEGRRIVFQTWDWAEDASSYQIEMFFMRQDGDSWQTNSYRSQLRAWQRKDISRILKKLGFTKIAWKMPEESGFYQPIVTARKSKR